MIDGASVGLFFGSIVVVLPMTTRSKIVNYPLWVCLFPFAVSVTLLFVVSVWQPMVFAYYNEFALLTGAMVAVVLAWRYGVKLGSVFGGVVANIRPILPTFAFLVLIGATATSWLLGGIIPAGIYFGIAYLRPAFFLVAVTLFTAMMGLACGSSWLTVGTMGVAFLGIGNVLGFHAPLVAGAVISGAYFGDKLTPLSETTVLAASMTKTPLLRHVSYMLWTAIPTFLVTLCLFGVCGLMYRVEGRHEANVADVLSASFDIRAVWLLVPLVVMLLTMLRFSPYTTLIAAIVLGYLAAFFYQRPLLERLADNNDLSYIEAVRLLLVKTFFGVHHAVTPTAGSYWSRLCGFWGGVVGGENKGANDAIGIDRLLVSGGVLGMWPTVSIVLASLVLSGVMEGAGMLRSLMARISNMHSNKKLIVLTTLTAVFFNITVADQYLAIILTAKVFAPLFKQQGLASENASRAIEDAATVTSPLIPWNTCGVAQAQALQIPTLSYLPYCFYNLLSPVVSVVFMYANLKIARTKQRSVVCG